MKQPLQIITVQRLGIIENWARRIAPYYPTDKELL